MDILVHGTRNRLMNTLREDDLPKAKLKVGTRVKAKSSDSCSAIL